MAQVEWMGGLSENQVSEAEQIVQDNIPGINQVRVLSYIEVGGQVVVEMWGNLIGGSTELVWLMDVELDNG
jgi:ABC-type antimicrobial peptide transport system permease subunit